MDLSPSLARGNIGSYTTTKNLPEVPYVEERALAVEFVGEYKRDGRNTGKPGKHFQFYDFFYSQAIIG